MGGGRKEEGHTYSKNAFIYNLLPYWGEGGKKKDIRIQRMLLFIILNYLFVAVIKSQSLLITTAQEPPFDVSVMLYHVIDIDHSIKFGSIGLMFNVLDDVRYDYVIFRYNKYTIYLFYIVILFSLLLLSNGTITIVKRLIISEISVNHIYIYRNNIESTVK